MRLKNIKLAGFKTFVDPVTIPLSAQRVAIVGPNGCGKSNVIDAVRCVLGESSAKYLRGEAIADMIFNGSSGRKPVGQAFIELLFDNTDGQLGGEYAAYSEIAIKRQISRDGQSQYYLNGSRCRRSDIIDIFLGTGLGPRNYAIIEQNTTLLAEAKPEVLRAAIEEVAGVSRYKERRHETALRIEHTRENLDRLSDLRQEIEKQLAHLQKQANAANRYTRLKEEERNLRTQLFNLRASTLNTQLGLYHEQVKIIESQFSAANSKNAMLETTIQTLRDELHKAQEIFDNHQAELHRIDIELTKFVQTRQHQADHKTKLMLDQEQAIALLKETQQQMSTDQIFMEQLTQSLEEMQKAHSMLKQESQEAQQEEQTLKKVMQGWQAEWDAFQKNSSETQRQIEVEQMRISQLNAHLNTLLQQMDRLNQENEVLNQQTQQDQNNFADQLVTLQTQIDVLEQELVIINTSINAYLTLLQSLKDEAKKAQQELQTLRESFASLNALQQVALGQGQENTHHIDWLKTHGLLEKPRLAQLLDVSKGFEKAIEIVLSFYLEAICFEEKTNLLAHLHALPEASFSLLSPYGKNLSTSAINTQLNLPSLEKYVNAPWSLGYLLSDVYVADSLENAFSVRDQLKAHESIVTQEGIWLGPNWVRVQRDPGEKTGLIQRERELVSLKEKISQVQIAFNEYENAIVENQQLLTAKETQRNDFQQKLSTLKHQQAETRGQLQAQQLESERTSKRLEEIQNQLLLNHEECQNHEQAEEFAKKTLEAAKNTMAQQIEFRDALLKQREAHEITLSEKTQHAKTLREKTHETALKVESLTAQINATQQHRERLEKQLQQQKNQLLAIEEELSKPSMFDHSEEDLKTLETLRNESQNHVSATKQNLESLHQQEASIISEKTASEREVNILRDQLENERLSQKISEERFAALQEQMHELGCTFSTEETFEGVDELALEKDLEYAQTRIANLGAINLAAIEELKEHQERKDYLDAQNNDLEEALQSLENAIRQIDDQTRHRFKEAFDALNARFEKLFPRLFGGGQGKLVLNENDWLKGGVQVIAQPPGKRNSTIHLLSGGEKALTAIALVFSLFELNPAPFCILDEIDAPLDDANIGRFCELVKEMSDRVQFIFITHNKVAMEMAQHLIGVTSHEPGISRLVAVDIEQAISMAEKITPIKSTPELELETA